jgi:glycine/D-amino acid oxidase-like deaminating enzyme
LRNLPPVSKPLSSAPHSLVIGGGVIGLTTAWALLQVGHRVSLIEQGELAGGASRANGGQLSYRYVSPLADAGVPLEGHRLAVRPRGPAVLSPRIAGGAVELAGAVPVEMPRLGEPSGH